MNLNKPEYEFWNNTAEINKVNGKVNKHDGGQGPGPHVDTHENSADNRGNDNSMQPKAPMSKAKSNG